MRFCVSVKNPAGAPPERPEREKNNRSAKKKTGREEVTSRRPKKTTGTLKKQPEREEKNNLYLLKLDVLCVTYVVWLLRGDTAGRSANKKRQVVRFS